MAKKKVLLMGKAHSGKTSMRSIIFANYLARDTTRLSPTLDVEHHHVRFLGDLVLNLWDCGGQDAFYESYFERDRETIFRSVELLIYVFDIESQTAEKDFDHFCGVLEAIEENSPEARIFVLVHKMDLVAEHERDFILDDRKRLIGDSCESCGVESYHIFGTSIWDETLYKAWSEIVTNLIPNIRLLESQLVNFCRICDAEEVVLFERATFLVISHAQATDNDINDTELELDDYSDTEYYDADNNDDEYDHNNNDMKDPDERIRNGSSGTDVNGNGTRGTDTESNSLGALAGTELTPELSTGSATASADATGTNSSTGTLDNFTVASTDGPILKNGDSIISNATSTGTETTRPTGNRTQTTSTTTLQVRRKKKKKLNSRRTAHFDAHRFEKISNIVKQFKLSCGKAQSQFQGMEVRNSRFAAFIDAFTANTYIMVIVSDPTVHAAATILNIQNARDHFEKFIPRI